MPQRTVTEALAFATKPITPGELRQWWNDAADQLVRAERVAEVGFDKYDPTPERVLRLISEIGRGPPKGE